MKFTSKDLMETMGLQVGDRVKVKSVSVNGNDTIYTIVKNGFCLSYEKDRLYNIFILIDQDFEILPRPKRVGDLMCGEIEDCRTCSLQWICFAKIGEKIEMKKSLYELLDSFAVEDQEIYDLLKARLDKEVKENEK